MISHAQMSNLSSVLTLIIEDCLKCKLHWY